MNASGDITYHEKKIVVYLPCSVKSGLNAAVRITRRHVYVFSVESNREY